MYMQEILREMITCLSKHDHPIIDYVIQYQTSKESEIIRFIRPQWFLSALKFSLKNQHCGLVAMDN
jgi:hypothetical protein